MPDLIGKAGVVIAPASLFSRRTVENMNSATKSRRHQENRLVFFLYQMPLSLLRQKRMSLWLSVFVPARQSAAFRPACRSGSAGKHAGVAPLFD